jgi:hypothetical protein
MKLTKENYEMQMFDLLEGNLSKEEEQSLLADIESDEFFAKEWNLFSASVLEPETIVFQAKDSLLQKEKAIVVPLRTKWQIFSYAAAVAAVFVGLFWFVQKGPDTGQFVEGSTSNSQKNIASELPNTSKKSSSAVQASAEKDLQIREEDIKTNVAVVSEQKDLDLNDKSIRNNSLAQQKQDEITSKKVKEENNIIPEPDFIIDPSLPNKPLQQVRYVEDNLEEKQADQPREILVDLKPKKTPNNQSPDIEKVPTTVDNILKPEIALAPAIAYTGLRAFLRRSALKMISPFRNPEFKMARVEEKNKPALNISFSSDAYYASATLHLK